MDFNANKDFVDIIIEEIDNKKDELMKRSKYIWEKF